MNSGYSSTDIIEAEKHQWREDLDTRDGVSETDRAADIVQARAVTESQEIVAVASNTADTEREPSPGVLGAENFGSREPDEQASNGHDGPKSSRSDESESRSAEQEGRSGSHKSSISPSYAAIWSDRKTWKKLENSGSLSVCDVKEWESSSSEAREIKAAAKRLLDAFRQTGQTQVTDQIVGLLNKGIPSPKASVEAFNNTIGMLMFLDAVKSDNFLQEVAGKLVTRAARITGVPEPFAIGLGALTKILLTSGQRQKPAYTMVQMATYANVVAYALAGRIGASPGLYSLIKQKESMEIGKVIDDCIAHLHRH